MRKPQGYATIIDPEASIQEMDTFTCSHCGAVTHVHAGQRPEDIGGLCKCCMGLVCPKCAGKPCTPFLKQLEEAEAKYEARRSYGL